MRGGRVRGAAVPSVVTILDLFPRLLRGWSTSPARLCGYAQLLTLSWVAQSLAWLSARRDSTPMMLSVEHCWRRYDLILSRVAVRVTTTPWSLPLSSALRRLGTILP